MKDDIRQALHEALRIEGVTYYQVKPDGHNQPVHISKDGILGYGKELITWGELSQYEALAQDPNIEQAVEKFNSQFINNKRPKFKMHNAR